MDLGIGWGRNFRMLKGIYSCIGCNKTTAALVIIEILLGKNQCVYTKAAIKTLCYHSKSMQFGACFLVIIIIIKKRKNNYVGLCKKKTSSTKAK